MRSANPLVAEGPGLSLRHLHDLGRLAVVIEPGG